MASDPSASASSVQARPSSSSSIARHSSKSKSSSGVSSTSSTSHSPLAITTHLSNNTLKQLKFVLPGGVVTYTLGTLARFWKLVESDGWAKMAAWIALTCGLATIALFLYLLLIPWIRGVELNYSQWRKSAELSFVIPTLTTLMVFGWPFLSFTLSQFTDLGIFKGVTASMGLYALGFGLLGLVPSPMFKRQG